MHDYTLILTITAGLAGALALGYFTHRLGLSPIVGYLLAGTLVGPHTPGFVADVRLAEQLAEIGVILLMFGVGLQFHLDELLAVRRVAIPGALAQSGAATLLGIAVLTALGGTDAAGLVFGIALSVASTVVLIRVLTDHGALHTEAGHIAVGWLVVEDLLTVLALVLLPAILRADATTSLPLVIALTLGKVVGLIAFTALVGTRVIPRILDHVARTRSRELFTLTVLVLALGIAVGAAKVFDVSMALGAFLAGMVVGRSDFSLRAASEALPMRDAFAVLFFVSVGMLLNPSAVLDSPWLMLSALAIVLVAKPLVAFLITWVMRYPLRTSLTVAFALAQIGEFSFILASLGLSLGITTPALTNTLVTTAIVSIVLNPLLFRAIAPLAAWVDARPHWRRRLDRQRTRLDVSEAVRPEPPRHRAVVVGYGPTGATVVDLLRNNGITPTVVELNMDTVKQLRQQGLDAVGGDATRPETLVAAGVAEAGTLVLGSTHLSAGPEVIRLARSMNPTIRVLARAAYIRDTAPLFAAGADAVYSGEAEVALAFAEDILRSLGATPEQIDRARANVHQHLAGTPLDAPA